METYRWGLTDPAAVVRSWACKPSSQFVLVSGGGTGVVALLALNLSLVAAIVAVVVAVAVFWVAGVAASERASRDAEWARQVQAVLDREHERVRG